MMSEAVRPLTIRVEPADGYGQCRVRSHDCQKACKVLHVCIVMLDKQNDKACYGDRNGDNRKNEAMSEEI